MCLYKRVRAYACCVHGKNVRGRALALGQTAFFKEGFVQVEDVEGL